MIVSNISERTDGLDQETLQPDFLGALHQFFPPVSGHQDDGRRMGQGRVL